MAGLVTRLAAVCLVALCAGAAVAAPIRIGAEPVVDPRWVPCGVLVRLRKEAMTMRVGTAMGCAVLLMASLAGGQEIPPPDMPEWADAELTSEIRARIADLGAAATPSEHQAEEIWRLIRDIQPRGPNTDVYGAIRQQGLLVLPILDLALLDADSEVRRKAAIATTPSIAGVTHTRPEAVCAVLVPLLSRSVDDPDPLVRGRIAVGLSVVGGRGRLADYRQHLDARLFGIVVNALEELRRDDDRLVREGAERALFRVRAGPDPYNVSQAEGFTVAADAFGERFRPGDAIPVLLALGYAGDETVWLEVYDCAIELTEANGDARYMPTSNTRRVSTGFWHYEDGRPQERMEVDGRERLVYPVGPVQPNSCYAEILEDWQDPAAPLQPGDYTIVVHVDLRRYAAESVFPREGKTPPWGVVEEEIALFYLRSAPVSVEIW